MTGAEEPFATGFRSGRISRRRLIGDLGAAGVGAMTANVLLAACASDARTEPGRLSTAPTTPVPVRGGILQLGGLAPGAQFDPPTFTNGTIKVVLNLATEHLVHTAPDGTIEPQLAVAWEPSPDGLRWTFTLRPGVRFTDGAPLSAAAVVASIERLIAPDSTSSAKGTFAGVLAGIEAVDDSSVAFVLERPFGDFPYLVSSTNFNTVILPEGYDGDWQANPVGTGPLRITDLRVDQGVTFERHEGSWRADEIYVDGARFTFFADPQAVLLALQGGEIDLAPIADPTVAAMLDRDRFGYVTAPSNGFTALALRVDMPPFDRVEVRQAVAWALDRTAMNEVFAAGEGSIGNDHIFGPVHTMKPQGLAQRERDFDKVTELLGGTELSFEITTVRGIEETYATLLQQQLAEAGIDVSLSVLSSDGYYATGDAPPWLSAPATVTYWASRPSPSQFVGLMLSSTATWNASHYANTEVDELTAAYDASTDDASRQEAADSLAAVLHDDVPVVIALYNGVNRAFAKRVHGVVADPSHSLNISGLWLDG
jgi:peptide/nickel transport system substrate-binding protein